MVPVICPYCRKESQTEAAYWSPTDCPHCKGIATPEAIERARLEQQAVEDAAMERLARTGDARTPERIAEAAEEMRKLTEAAYRRIVPERNVLAPKLAPLAPIPIQRISIHVTELNTMSNPKQGWRDETPRIRCSKCGNLFLLGQGMNADPEIMAITRKHRELCEGDAAVTLMRVEQAYKAGWRPIAVAELEPVTEEELVHWDANADLYDANMEFIEIIRRLIAEVRRLRRS